MDILYSLLKKLGMTIKNSPLMIPYVVIISSATYPSSGMGTCKRTVPYRQLILTLGAGPLYQAPG